MTIKQQGGIFGRNPTFNDVDANTVETASLTVSGLTAARVPFAGSGGTLTDDQDLSFSGNVLTVKGTGTQQLDVRSRGSGYGQAGGINIYGNDTDTDGLLISKSGSGSGAPVARADIINQANSDFRLGSNNTPHMTIKGGGDVQLLTGNLVVTSGKGIDFSATSGTGTSELFDDYEEGTHTTTLTPYSGSITLSTSYNTLSYTKVGGIVHVWGQVRVASVLSPSGYAILSMPFTAATGSQRSNRSAAATWTYNLISAQDELFGLLYNGTDELRLAEGLTHSGNFSGKLQANSQIAVSVTYKVA